MSISQKDPALAATSTPAQRIPVGIPHGLRRFTVVAGGFYLTMAGINFGLAIGNPQTYAAFADAALFDWVRQAWLDVFMAHPAVWAGLLGAGEVLVGSALLAGGRWALAGLLAVIAFHLALMIFGWGVALWAVPVLAATIPVTRAYLRALRRSPTSR